MARGNRNPGASTRSEAGLGLRRWASRCDYAVGSFGLAGRSAVTLITQLLTTALQLPVLAITARALGPQGKGLAAALQSNAVLLSTLGGFSLTVPIIYCYGRRQWTAGEFAGTLAALALASGATVCLLALGVFAVWGNVVYPSILSAWFVISLTVVPCQLLSASLSALARGMQKAVLYNGLSVSASVIGAVAVTVAMILWPHVMGVVAARAFASVLSLAVAVMAVRETCRRRWEINWALGKELLRGGAQLHLGSLCTFLYTAGLGPIMVNGLGDAAEAGYFAVGSKLAGVLLFVPLAVQTFLYAQASSASQTEAEALVAKASRHTLLWTCCGALGLILVSRVAVVALAGPAFLAAAWTAVFLAPGIVLHSVTMTSSALLIRNRQFVTMTWIAVMMAALSVAGALVTIPRWGSIGLALTTSAVYAIGFAVTAFVVGRLTRVSARDLVVAKAVDLQYYITFVRRAAAARSQRL